MSKGTACGDKESVETLRVCSRFPGFLPQSAHDFMSFVPLQMVEEGLIDFKNSTT